MAVIRARNISSYTLKIGSFNTEKFKVIRFSGIEGISELFQFNLELASSDGEIDFEAIIGEPAALTIYGPKGKRYLHGVVSLFEHTGKERKLWRYRAEIVPAAWMLTRRYNCRIFQGKTVPEILQAVLADGGIGDIKSSLKGKYEAREYCVQYRESDWAFITRLMEQYGIFYFFDHDEAKHILVMADDPVVNVPIVNPAKILYRQLEEGGSLESEYISEFRFNNEVRSGEVKLTDFDFKKPRLDLKKEAKVDGGRFTVYDYPGEYLTPDEGERLAKVRLDELQATRKNGSGQSDCRRLIPGYRFTLDNYSRTELNREYLLTRVSHRGSQSQVLEQDAGTTEETLYENEFECIPSDVPFRPTRSTPKPIIQGPQTAMIVGPKGEEIYVDEYGRVKVLFHWDQEGQEDEKSSCWIRVSHPWAGAGWGAVFLPRIGQEVVVEFLEGDPDRPLITGSVYNGDNKPPYALPGEKTKSTIKSNSSKGGKGSNEIRFEDKKGDEQLFIQGEKDVDIRVKNDRYEFVGRDRHLIVKRDKFEHIENSRHEKVDSDHIEQIGKDRHLHVKGKEAREIGESRSLTVKGNVIEVFKAGHSEQTSGDYYLKASNVVIEATSNITLKVGSSYIAIEASGITIQGLMTTEVKGTQVTVKADAILDMEGGALTNVKSSGMTTVKGSIVMIN
jgi:type VI secretion system secreted protein VgrG